jgi:hypothetical protein
LRWEFKGLPPHLKKDPKNKIKIRYKIFTSEHVPESLCQVVWILGKREVLETQVTVEEFIEFTTSSAIIAQNDTIEVIFKHNEPNTGIISFPPEGIEILYATGSFYGNYLRGLFLIFMILCFLNLLGLFASTFLTFPIAMLLSFYVMGLGLAADFLLDLIPMGADLIAQENKSIWYFISQKILSILFFFVPNFSKYNPIDFMALGRMIEWSLVFKSIVEFLFLRGAMILGTLGCVLFYSREIGKPLE